MMDAADLEFLLEQFTPEQLQLAADAQACERDLAKFYRECWSSVDPAPFQTSFHIEAIADHLMAVTDGDIKTLLINVPFRSGKTLIVSVAWPCWTWAQSFIGARSGPQVSFLCLSYASKLSLDNSLTARRLLGSEWYQARWGERVTVAKDKDSLERFDTTRGGSRMSAGFDGSTLGRGGAIKIIDDPHKVQEVESDLVRESIIKTYDEAITSRFTDPATSAEVIIMQRLGEDDLSGHILEKKSNQPGFCHLMIPGDYDPERHCRTMIGWNDPRGMDRETGEMLDGLDAEGKLIHGSPLAARDGMNFWPERFPPEIWEQLKENLGPFAVAGQLNQSPAPRGGGVIKKEWWRLWQPEQFPDFGTVIVSVDTAYTEKEENDYSAATVWGAFPSQTGNPLFMLKDAWQGRVELNTLVTKLADMAQKHRADYMLIEGKASGKSVIQEILRLYGNRQWSTIEVPVKGDKLARLISVQPFWSGKQQKNPHTGKDEWVGGVIYAPDRSWADLVIDSCASFPKTKFKDIVDTVSQAMNWLRVNNVAVTREEYDDEALAARQYKKSGKALYDI